MPDEKLQLMCLKRVLEAMPAGNKIIINRVCAMFSAVVAFEHENKMSAKNLALVLNPSMFRYPYFFYSFDSRHSSIITPVSFFFLLLKRDPGGTISSFVQGGRLRSKLVEILIDNHSLLMVHSLFFLFSSCSFSNLVPFGNFSFLFIFHVTDVYRGAGESFTT